MFSSITITAARIGAIAAVISQDTRPQNSTESLCCKVQELDQHIEEKSEEWKTSHVIAFLPANSYV